MFEPRARAGAMERGGERQGGDDGAGERPAPLRYALDEDAVRARARATSALTAVATTMPPLLVVVLLAQLDLAPVAIVAPIAALLALLGVARGVVGHRAALRRLRAFEVTVLPDALAVRALRAALNVPRDAIARVVEIDGRLGGLRLELREADGAAGDGPERIDVPRGGARFGDLRAALAAWLPIERARRRGPATRVVLGAVVVLAMFFMPFVIDDVTNRSRVAACAVILVAWLAMRAALARA